MNLIKAADCASHRFGGRLVIAGEHHDLQAFGAQRLQRLLDRLAVGGDSAGGNLTAVLALMARDGVLPKVGFQLLLFSLALLERDGALMLFNWIAALAAIAFFGFSSGQLVGYTVDLFQRWF